MSGKDKLAWVLIGLVCLLLLALLVFAVIHGHQQEAVKRDALCAAKGWTCESHESWSCQVRCESLNQSYIGYKKLRGNFECLCEAQ